MRPSPRSPHLSHHRVDSYRHCSSLWSATHTSQHVTFYLCSFGNKVRAFPAALVVKNPRANAGDRRGSGSIPGWGRSPEGGHGNPPQYACLENPMDRGAWWATAHRVTHSQTPLKRLSTHVNKVFFSPSPLHRTLTMLATTQT